MHDSTAPHHSRLARLSAYLQQDPENVALLAEAFDEALASGRPAEAQSFLRIGEQLAPGAAEWKFRRAQVSIALRDLVAARTLLEELQRSTEDREAVLHDLAHVHLLEGNAARARELLADCIQVNAQSGHRAALQVLWLRACHHLGALDDAWVWVQRAQKEGALEGAAAGVASLVALDCGELEEARGLADAGLAVDPALPEALATKGSLALSAGDPAAAEPFFRAVLASHPEDGRSWSGVGLARLLAQDVGGASAAFERALRSIPGHVPTWQALGWARMLQRDRQAAIDAFHSALACDAASAEAHASLALALALSGDREGAARQADEAQRIDAADPTLQIARLVMQGADQGPALTAMLDAALRQWRPRP